MTSAIITGFIDNSALNYITDNPHYQDRNILSLNENLNRQKFIAGRVLARALIANLTGEDVATIDISVDASNRPVHIHPKPVLFSISHSGNLTAVAAVSSDSQLNKLGVDLEYRLERHNMDVISKAWFHSSECCLLDNTSDRESKKRLFYKLWTAKEAWVKAHGQTVWKIGTIPPLEIDEISGNGLWLELPGGFTLAIIISAFPDFHHSIKADNVIIHHEFPYPGIENHGKTTQIFNGKFRIRENPFNFTGDRT